MIEAATAKRLIDLLAATPRGAGTDEETRARAVCAAYLQERGFEVREQTFSYSKLPAAGGLPIAGTFMMLIGVALVLWSGEGHGWPRGVSSLAALLVVAFWCWFILAVVRGRMFRGSRTLRATGTNLVATRGTKTPSIWLSAHIDTKSQPFPTLLRTIALMLALLTTLALIVFSFAEALVADASSIWMVLGIAVAVASLPLLASTVGNDSPGAADNASGVAAVLLAADETSGAPLGVVITSAEELWLAGSRAWSRSSEARSGDGGRPVIVNCDTVDEEGPMRCLYHRRADVRLARAVASHGAKHGIGVRLVRFTPGILVDSSTFARAGIPAVTLSRVSFRTLGRIHSPRDSAGRLTGEGAALAAQIMGSIVREGV